MQGKDSAGNSFGIDSIIITETVINKLQPLLPFIFFEEDSSSIPSRYSRINNPETFITDDMAEQSKLEVYSSIMNIIGQRLRNKPTAKLILTGCNAHFGKERGNRELSRMRAEAVRTYLHEKWGIALDRMTISVRNLPANASITRTGIQQDIEDSRQENRRVEIYSDDPTILEPVHIQKTNTKIEPEKIQLIFPGNTLQTKEKKQLFVKMNDQVILQKIISQDDSDMTLDPMVLTANMKNDGLSKYDITILGKSLQDECSTSLSIPILKNMKIDKQKLDSSYSEYTLMLFPFNSSEWVRIIWQS